MQSLECTKELVGVAGVESDAVVPHIVSDFTVFVAHADVDVRRGSLGRELECVPDQVVECDSQESRIGTVDEIGRDRNFDLTLAICFL